MVLGENVLDTVEQSHAPTRECRRRRAGHFWSAAAARRPTEIGGGGALEMSASAARRREISAPASHAYFNSCYTSNLYHKDLSV